MLEVLKFCSCKLQVEERQKGEKRPEGNSGRTRLTRGQNGGGGSPIELVA